jgi:hypothetical protein
MVEVIDFERPKTSDGQYQFKEHIYKEEHMTKKSLNPPSIWEKFSDKVCNYTDTNFDEL